MTDPQDPFEAHLMRVDRETQEARREMRQLVLIICSAVMFGCLVMLLKAVLS